jgi:subtilase family serine protease
MQPATNGHPRSVQRVNRLADPSGAVFFGCQITVPAQCFGPDQIRVAYNLQPLLDQHIDGSGRTIVIVDAYGSPALATNLHDWDTLWGIPDPVLDIRTPFGIDPTSVENAFGWGVETSLDVEWAHAIAPAAKIVLVVAKSNNDADINAALEYAVVNNLGDVISMSFGEGEICMAPADRANMHATFESAHAKNITLFASSGDQGSAQPACDGSDSFFLSTSIPATDPNVTAVGGTNLIADGRSGAYQSETTWNETALFGPAATGGGHSVLFNRPSYQAPVVKDEHAREVPDVAYNGGINGGVLVLTACPAVVCGVNGNFFFRVGGTSAGSPQWAGLIALADQIAGVRVGDVNKTLYKLGKGNNASTYFHDITTGDNGLIDVGPGTGTPIAGFAAGPGYDMSTGWGTPIANALVPAIAKPGNG